MAVKLSRREKQSIYLVFGFICVFIVVQFAVYPLMDKKSLLKRSIQAKAKMLENIISLKNRYDTINRKEKLAKIHFSQRKKGFTLFSFLDRLSGKAGIKEHITYMKPSTTTRKNSPFKISMVEMKLQAVTLNQLTPYLYMVETSENMVKIKRLSISQTGKNKDFINAVLQVETSER